MLAEPPCVILLYRAILTLGALPDPDARYFVVASTWPTYARRYLDAYDPDHDTEVGWHPTPQDISNYLNVLRWANGLSQRQRRIMWKRADGYSLAMIAEYLNTHITDVEQLHTEAVNIIARASWLDKNTHIWCGPLDKPQNLTFQYRRHHCA